MGGLPWSDIMEIIVYDLWLLTLWNAISLSKGRNQWIFLILKMENRIDFSALNLYDSVFLTK